MFGGSPPARPFAEVKKEYEKRIQTLHEFFENARRYQQAKASNARGFETDLKFEAMLPVLEGKTPVIVLVPPGSSGPVVEGRRREAENLRSRFSSCSQGLALARGLRDVAVREPVSRSSADLPQQLRDLLGNMQVGQMTIPEATPQGLQMFALCDKRESKIDTPAKRDVRQKLYMKKFEAESKRFLEEVRKSAMIEYK